MAEWKPALTVDLCHPISDVLVFDLHPRQRIQIDIASRQNDPQAKQIVRLFVHHRLFKSRASR
jgi:hypothetical protein